MLKSDKKKGRVKISNQFIFAPFLVNGGGFPISHHLTIKHRSNYAKRKC
jgi:hypothetical protein